MYEGKELEEGEICEHSDTEYPVKNGSMQNPNTSVGDHLKNDNEEKKRKVLMGVGVTNKSTTFNMDIDANPVIPEVVRQQFEKISDPDIKSEIGNINDVINQPEMTQQKLEEVFPDVKISCTTSEIKNMDILQPKQELIQQQLENMNNMLHSSINNRITVSEIGTTPQELTQQPLELTQQPLEITGQPLEITQQPLEITQQPLEITQQPLDIRDYVMDPHIQDRSTSSEVDDIDVLLCRHELIRQQLNIVNAKDIEREEINTCEKVSKKKRKGKKKRKNRPIMGNSISLSITSPIKNNDRDNSTFRKSLSVPDKLGDEIDEELLALRNEVLSHSLNKSQINNDKLGLINKSSEKKMKVKNKSVNKNSNKRPCEKDSTFKLSKISTKQINIEGNQRISKPLQSELLKSLSYTNARNISSQSNSKFVQGGSHEHQNTTLVKASAKKRRRLGKRERKRVPLNPASKMTKSKGYLAYSAQQEKGSKNSAKTAGRNGL